MSCSQRLSLLLTLLSVILLAIGISESQWRLGALGFIHSLAPPFWAGLVLLTVASGILFLAKGKNDGLFLTQVLILIAALRLPPLLIGSTVGAAQPNILESYAHFGYTDYLLRTGHIRPEMLEYHSWPNIWTLTAALLLTMGLETPEPLFAVTWFGTNLAYLGPLVLFLKRAFGKESILPWAGVWLFLLGSALVEDDLSMRILGHFFFFALLAWLMPGGIRPEGVSHRLVRIVLFGASVTAHFLSSLLIVVTALVLYLRRSLDNFSTVLLFAVMIGAWMLYYAATFWELAVPQLVDQLFRLDLLLERGLLEPQTQGSAARTLVVRLRLLMTALLFLIALVGIALSWRRRQTLAVLGTLLSLALAYGLAFAILGLAYGWGAPQRLFLYVLPITAFFGACWLTRRTTAILLVAFLLLLLPLHFISSYGSMSARYAPPGYISGLHFFHARVDGGRVTDEYGGPFGRFRNIERYAVTEHYETLAWEGENLKGVSGKNHYITIGQPDRGRYEYHLAKGEWLTQIWERLDRTRNLSLIYANPHLSIYLHPAQ